MRTEQGSDASTRIAFVINSLAGGGAERVFCRIIEGLEAHLRDCESEIMLLDDEPRAYTPPAFARCRTLGADGSFAASVAKLSGAMRRFRPHVAVSFLSRANCANVIAGRWCGYRTVISERVATLEHFGQGAAAQVKRAVTRELYRRADAIVAVSEGVRRGLVEWCQVPAPRIEVIPNPVDVARIREWAAQSLDIVLPAKFIVSVNRLTAKKNVPLQLEALQRSGLPHHWVILGDGPDRAALEALAVTLGLRDRVHFLGFVSNPFAIMAQADMFVSTSNAEGFPNALAEAMALGVPCVATNCRSGPAEILADEPKLETTAMLPTRFGVLIPVGDADACAAALCFLARPEQRADYSRRASERAVLYSPESIIARYWRVIARVADEARPGPAVRSARVRA